MPETSLAKLKGANLKGEPSSWNAPRGNQRAAFYSAVFTIVSRIPKGRVTTYGSIAFALGRPNAARSVGWALSIAPTEADLPCHRVVNRDGFLSGGWHWGHPDVMAGLLRDEGVPFIAPHRVDLRGSLWFPDEEPETFAD